LRQRAPIAFFRGKGRCWDSRRRTTRALSSCRKRGEVAAIFIRRKASSDILLKEKKKKSLIRKKRREGERAAASSRREPLLPHHGKDTRGAREEKKDVHKIKILAAKKKKSDLSSGGLRFANLSRKRPCWSRGGEIGRQISLCVFRKRRGEETEPNPARFIGMTEGEKGTSARRWRATCASRISEGKKRGGARQRTRVLGKRYAVKEKRSPWGSNLFCEGGNELVFPRKTLSPLWGGGRGKGAQRKGKKKRFSQSIRRLILHGMGA